MTEEQKFSKDRKRNEAIIAKGGCCELCKSKEKLCFHHKKGCIVNGVNEHRKKVGMYERIIKGEADDIQLLCERCHKDIHGWHNYDAQVTPDMTAKEKEKIYRKFLNEKRYKTDRKNFHTYPKEWTFRERRNQSQRDYMARKRQKMLLEKQGETNA